MNNTAVKRIINKDFKEIENINLNANGIFIEFNEENILEANAMIIGPKDSIYEGAFLFFKINFPKNYPFAPPVIKYLAQNKIRIHPNIYVNGKVCLSILGTWSGPKWTSIMDITTVLLTIQSLLDNNPIRHEPGQEKNESKMNKDYNTIIEYNTFHSLIKNRYSQDLGDFEIFKPHMDEYLKNNYKFIFNKIEKNKVKYKDIMNIQLSFYRINLNIDYSKLFIDFKQIFNKFDN